MPALFVTSKIEFSNFLILELKMLQNAFKIKTWCETSLSISSCQRDLMKTYHNEANTTGIKKNASKFFLKFFEQYS